jgi:hypothetical protein
MHYESYEIEGVDPTHLQILGGQKVLESDEKFYATMLKTEADAEEVDREYLRIKEEDEAIAFIDNTDFAESLVLILHAVIPSPNYGFDLKKIVQGGKNSLTAYVGWGPGPLPANGGVAGVGMGETILARVARPGDGIQTVDIKRRDF